MDLKEATATRSICRSETCKNFSALVGQRERERKREEKEFTLTSGVDVQRQ